MRFPAGSGPCLDENAAQANQVTSRILRWHDALVDLGDKYALPRQRSAAKMLQHDPGCFAAAACNDREAAFANGVAARGLDAVGCPPRGSVRIGLDGQLQGTSPREPGSYQPP